MTPEDKIKEIMTGIGAMSETLYLFYSSCKNAGFDEDKAMTLTVAFMASLVSGGAKKGEQDDS